MEDAMQVLEQSFAELSVQETTRKLRRVPMPGGLLAAQLGAAAEEAMGKLSSLLEQREAAAHFFGAPIAAIAKLWELITGSCGNALARKERLLRALRSWQLLASQSPSQPGWPA